MKIVEFAFQSSIGQKITMSVTGLLLCLFLIGHLVGNMLLYVSKQAFNDYANLLNSTKLIYLIEFGLAFVFVLHIVSAIRLTLANRKARPVAYSKRATRGKATFMSSYMFHSGMIILLFVVYHIYSFKFGPWDNQQIVHDLTLYDLVLVSFSNSIYSAGYVIAMIFLGFHLHHAFKSAFITLGLTHKPGLKKMEQISQIFSVIIAVGFSSFPIYFYFFQ